MKQKKSKDSSMESDIANGSSSPCILQKQTVEETDEHIKQRMIKFGSSMAFISIRIEAIIVQNTRQWDIDMLRSTFDEGVVNEIRKIPIGPPNMKDRWVWHHEAKGVFSIKSCYRMLKQGRGGNQQVQWKWIWQLSLPPKVKFFIWKMCSNLVATRENLMRRRCAQSPLCPCCNQVDESVPHLLFGCAVTKDIWRKLMPDISPPADQQSIQDWLEGLRLDGQQNRVIKAGLCCWIIWKTRNEMSFEGIIPTQQGMRIRLFKEINLWERSAMQARGRGERDVPADGEQNHQTQEHQMPRNHKWRFLSDGSFKENVQEAGIRIIVVNPEGRIVNGEARRLLCRGPIVAEAMAVLTACKMAARERVEAEVWSDCRQVVQACSEEDAISPWECAAVIEDIKEVLNQAPLVTIVKCSRNKVAVADEVARRKRDNTLEPHWIQHLTGRQIL